MTHWTRWLAGPAGSEPMVAYLTGDAGALGLGLDPDGGGLLLFAASGPGRRTLHGVGDPRGGYRGAGLLGERPALHLLGPLPDRGRTWSGRRPRQFLATG